MNKLLNFIKKSLFIFVILCLVFTYSCKGCKKDDNDGDDNTQNVEIKHTINYNLDGGINAENAPKEFVEGTGLASLPTPHKAGYKFIGWYVGDKKYESIDKNVKSNITLTAKWEEIVLTSLEFDGDTIELNVGDSINTVINTNPSDYQLDLLTWTMDNDNIVFENGNFVAKNVGLTKCEVVDAKTGLKAETLFVINDLSKGKYPIVYENWNNSSDENSVKTGFYYSDTGLYQLPTPEEAVIDGYYFNGWTLNGEVVIDIPSEVTGLVTLVGIWSNNPSEINVSSFDSQLCVGSNLKIDARTNTNSTSFTYESSNVAIFTVDEEGNLTGVKAGKANLIITSIDNPELSTSVVINVYNIPTSISFKSTIEKVYLGNKAVLTISAKPVKSSTDVIYEVEDPSILSIDKSGNITPIKAGTTNIRVISLHNQELVIEKTIEVVEPATSVEVSGFDKDKYYIGDVINLSSVVYPNTVSQEVMYEVSDENIATITSDGVLTIIGRGDLTVVVRSSVSLDITWKKTFECLHELLEEEVNEVKYIISCPGEDASTTICINYHTMNTKTSLEYTLASDPEFKNFTTFIGEGKYFEEMDEKYESPFPARNIYFNEITGLTPGTEYIYRINKGDGTYSDTYEFKTAAGKGNNFSFLWLADNHYHDVASMEPVYLYSEQVIKQAMSLRSDLAFVFDTGDMIDRGGSYNQWDVMFKNRETLKYLPLVSTPGNHELYMNGTGQTDNRFHAAYNAQPKNSVEGKFGSSCFFIYNDVMFIMWDSSSNSNYDGQLAWLEETLRTTRENNSARMIVMGSHKPVHSEDPSYAVQDRDLNVLALCDKYSVDLFLTGHYHSQNVTPNYYDGKNSTNPLLGTNYMVGNSCRLEGSDANGYIIDIIDGNKIKVNLIDHNGNILSTWDFASKKEETPTEEALNTSKETILNSITYKLDESLNLVKFSWTSLAFGTVKKIKVTESLRGEEVAEAYIINKAYTSTTIKNIHKYYDGKYLIEVYFNDGTVLTKEVEVKRDTLLEHKMLLIEENNVVIGLTPAHNSLNYKIKKYDVYVNGEYLETIDYLDNNAPVSIYKIENLTHNTEYTVEFKAVEANGNIMFTNSITFTTRD